MPYREPQDPPVAGPTPEQIEARKQIRENETFAIAALAYISFFSSIVSLIPLLLGGPPHPPLAAFELFLAIALVMYAIYRRRRSGGWFWL